MINMIRFYIEKRWRSHVE